MTTITPIILAGGSGMRLWPLSRKSYPKQFSKLIDDTSLFRQSVSRFGLNSLVDFADPFILTNTDFRFTVVDELQNSNILSNKILIEPEGKNTGPAILAASLFALKIDPDAILLVAPSDHVILDETKFHEAVKIGLSQVEKGNIITFGIAADRPETGYGYLELGPAIGKKSFKIKRFIEKPDIDTAKGMLDSKRYLWNAGIFMFRAADIIAAFMKFAPQLMKPVKGSVENGKYDLGFFRLDPIAWADCEDISIDYAIMENADNLIAVPLSAGWSDLGDWNSVWKEQGPDQKGVVTTPNVTEVDCENVLLRAESDSQHLVGLGLRDIVAIAMPDAVLVANKNSVQDVKKVVMNLKRNDINQAETSQKDYRPWGWFEILIKQEQFKVKLIRVKAGAALSLQSHQYRSEHWIVVEGTIKVTVDTEVQILSKGESVFVPVGAIHRMENISKDPMTLIEVQTGSYLGEDDIVRYEDLYSRS